MFVLPSLIGELLEKKDEVQKKKLPAFNDYISAKDLSFSYDKQTEVLHRTNMTIEKGKKYVIM